MAYDKYEQENAWITGDSADTIRYRDSDNWPVPVDPANPPKKAR